MRILKNAARCKVCKTYIESHYRHDFQMCKCGKVFVDGGHDYLHWGGEPNEIEDLSVVEYEKGEEK